MWSGHGISALLRLFQGQGKWIVESSKITGVAL